MSAEAVAAEEQPTEQEEQAVEPQEDVESDGQAVKKEEDVSKATCSTTSPELEKLFADRYTEENASYAEIARGFDPVIVLHPWASRTKRIFDYSRGRGDHRGGWRGGNRGDWRGGNRGDWRGGNRGDWRGGNRGGWRGGNRGDWRGGEGRGGHDGGYKRHWEGDRGSGNRVHYPGRH